MRAIGDIYLRQEFKHHHDQPQIEFYRKFYNKWEEYYMDLSKKGLKEAAKNISKREEELLTNDQKEALKKLKDGLLKWTWLHISNYFGNVSFASLTCVELNLQF